MGFSRTIVCDQCTRTLGDTEKTYREIDPEDDASKIYCTSCQKGRKTYSDVQSLDYKDASISVTFDAGGAPAGA